MATLAFYNRCYEPTCSLLPFEDFIPDRFLGNPAKLSPIVQFPDTDVETVSTQIIVPDSRLINLSGSVHGMH